ncbi:hypothetical protein T06_5650 [Trichinella sp. T6]|nr:hypothetical protein T06_5650 [Trichinella sp. T6]
MIRAYALVSQVLKGLRPSKESSGRTLLKEGVCYDGPFWDYEKLRHGDVTGVLELECRPSSVEESVGV